MKKKRTRFLKLKFNIFVVLLCAATVVLAIGFDRIHADGIQLTEKEEEKVVAPPKVEEPKVLEKVQINKIENSAATESSATESSLDYDHGVAEDTDAENLIPVYAEPDENSEVMEEVFTGEWADYFGKEDGFVQIETNKGTLGYVSDAQANVTDIVDKKKPSSLKDAVIVIDAGHGGEDAGAESTNGVYFEKDFTLKTALAVKMALEAEGATVYLTRNKDEYISLDDRVDMAVENLADVFISLHYDSSEEADAMNGFTTYYYYRDEETLANSVNQGMVDADTSLKSIGVRQENFQVLRDNPYPALLLELGYINSYGDLIVVRESGYYKKVADGVTSGLEKYFAG